MALTTNQKRVNVAGLRALTAKLESRYLNLDTAKDITNAMSAMVDDGAATRRLAMSAAYRCGFNATEVQIPLDWNPERTNCSEMFKGNTAIEVMPWVDMSNVTNGYAMFMNCSAMTAIDPNITLGSLTSASFMFSGCEALTAIGPLKLNGCDNKQFMFQNCFNLERISLSVACKADKGMFQYCKSLKEIPKQIYSSSVCPDLSYCFYRCESITEFLNSVGAGVQIWDNTFTYCSSLVKMGVLGFAAATSMTNTFVGCTNVTTVEFRGLGAKMTTIDLSALVKWGTTAEGKTSLSNTIRNGLSTSATTMTRTLKLSSATKSALDDADIAYAASIGWTIA